MVRAIAAVTATEQPHGVHAPSRSTRLTVRPSSRRSWARFPLPVGLLAALRAHALGPNSPLPAATLGALTTTEEPLSHFFLPFITSDQN
jgi:hypothetical protein